MLVPVINIPRISDSEWEVMKAVWDHEPLTTVEVMKQLPRPMEAKDGKHLLDPIENEGEDSG